MNLNNLMARYKVDNLVNVSHEDFKETIESYQGMAFEKGPGQRRFETEFVWGHDHDFGSFQMKGRMGDRHIRVLEAFMETGIKLEGNILDVGVWTGGTSLLLVAMGCRVLAIEEVAHYATALRYLAYAFGIEDKLTSIALSVYDIPWADMDIVSCAGVLYHVTDPVYALRKMFESLRDGGKILIESAFCPGNEPILYYKGGGPSDYIWYLPTPIALTRMMEDVGFSDISYTIYTHRIVAMGTRKEYKPMIIAGTRGRHD